MLTFDYDTGRVIAKFNDYQCNTVKLAYHQLKHNYITIPNPNIFKTKNRSNGDYGAFIKTSKNKKYSKNKNNGSYSDSFYVFHKKYEKEIYIIQNQLKNLIHFTKNSNSRHATNPVKQKDNYNSVNVKNNYSGYNKKSYYKALGLLNEE